MATPQYDVDTRKFGDGYTFWKAHATAGDEAASPFDGENAIVTMITQQLAAGATLGGTTNPAEINDEAEMFEDFISQQAFPVQVYPVEMKATFKVTMSMGDAEKLAIAAGLIAATTSSNIIDNGVTTADAKTVVMGIRSPSQLTLLHAIPNSQTSGWFDYWYMPRCQVSLNVNIVAAKKDVREAEINFAILASHQDGTASGAITSHDMYIDASGTFGGWLSMNQSEDAS